MSQLNAQCAACARKGPEARCETCVMLFPTANATPIMQCLQCGEGEMMALTPGWLCCGLCRHQVELEKYGQQLDREKDGITYACVMAMLAEDRARGDRKGGGTGGKPKDAKGGMVDPETATPGIGYGCKIGGRLIDDAVCWSKTRTLDPLTENVQVRGIEASSDEMREAMGDLMRGQDGAA